jgi:hypothetical protein
MAISASGSATTMPRYGRRHDRGKVVEAFPLAGISVAIDGVKRSDCSAKVITPATFMSFDP